MPIRVQNDLPVKEILEQENIFVMDEFRAAHQDIRPISIGLLNLMPLKEDTELQILRALSNTPLQVDVTFVRVTSHVSKNTSTSHIYKFYEAFEDIKNKKFDGFIITGAPVEQMPFEDVDYWEELKGIMEWTKTNVVSTLHLCWGAQAGIYYHYGIDKVLLPEKRSGLYWHRVRNRKIPIVRGFDDMFLAPHSRHTEVPQDLLEADERITILADSDEAGVYMCMAQNGRQIFVMGHPEYDRMTLDAEYKRDSAKGLNPVIPKNYYPVAYDMERKGTFAGGRENTTAIAKAFCDTIADAGYVPMIYSSASFLNENFDWKKLKNCKVWVASYSDTRPKLPVSADLWQYTKKGSLEGANTDKGYCDLVYSYMEATSIKFTKPTLTMKKNTTAQATVKIKPNGCTDRKSFTSSNPKVVAVNKKTGKLTAKKAGKATIMVTTGSGRKAKMKVVVK